MLGESYPEIRNKSLQSYKQLSDCPSRVSVDAPPMEDNKWPIYHITYQSIASSPPSSNPWVFVTVPENNRLVLLIISTAYAYGYLPKPPDNFSTYRI